MGGGSLMCLVVCFLICGNEATRQIDDEIIDSCELNPILVPGLYDLKFDLNFPSRTFSGQVVISGKVESSTSIIVLDSAVSVVEVDLNDNENNNYGGQFNQIEKTLFIQFEDLLVPDKDYRLFIKFEGDIRNLRGIFGGNYTDSTNNESYFVATEFQPNYARYAFPCIDRPAYKAHYLLNVSREADHIALSNMPLAISLPDHSVQNKIWDSFEKSPLMSTYTFAFVIAKLFPCHLDDNDDTMNNTVWVIGEKESCQMVSYASKWTPLYMKHLEKYIDVKYEMPKLDHVALPYLASTAMENWGLIMYKQDVLLLNKTSHTVRSEFGLIWILAHEMTHQWFGNLVTCTSWAYTWLNEGITSFLHFFISGKVFPEWDMLGLMMTEEVQKVMDDEGFSAVSLTKENCTMMASDTFSMASYYKGAAVMRMVFYMLGEEEVKRGLQIYVQANKYGCVSQEDLWDHFEENAKLNNLIPKNTTLKTVMKTWSNNYGFPFITVTRENQSIKLEQERLVYFLPDDSPNQRWWIPVSYTTSNENNFSKTAPRFWMDPNVHPSHLAIKLKEEDWIYINVDQTGYYRVLYDNLTWAALTRQLKDNLESIPPLSRAKLIDDVFTLTFFKKLDYNIPLTLSRYLTQETHYYPWTAAIRALEHIHFYLKLTDVNEAFEKYMLKLVEKVFNNLSYFNDYNNSYRDTNSRLLHGKILNFACNLGHKGCEKRAEELMNKLLDGDEQFIRMHVDEINPLMCTMVKLGGQEIWDLAFEMYTKEKVYKPKDELMEALKCTRDEDVWKKFTRSFLDGEKDYESFDLFTSNIHDKKCYCFVIEVIDEILSTDSFRISDLSPVIRDLSGMPMPKKCRDMLKKVTNKYIEMEQEKRDIINSIDKSTTPWVRVKEIAQWFEEESNTIDSGVYSSESSDNNLIERSLYDGMLDETMNLAPYHHHRSHQDYDYETKHRKDNEINSSSSLEFNLFILLFSILPSPIYLTYLTFTPFI